MHEALLIDEIVRRITGHLFDDNSSSLAFSLCCRSLNDPVLNVLWRGQTDLVTLFKVFPPDLWEAGSPVRLRFQRFPTPDEWSRFRVYAQRMVVISLPRDDRIPSDDILDLINLDRSGHRLIPRLQILHWKTVRPFLPWLHRLLSPTLSSINIEFTGTHGTALNVAVIKALPSINLKYLTLSALGTDTEVSDSLLNLVLNSKQLWRLYISQESHTEDTSPTGDGIEDKREPIELESLKSIIITFKIEPSFLPRLFDRATFPNIREICIQHMGMADWSGADDLFNSVLRSASPDVFYSFRYLSKHHGIDITPTRIQSLQRFVALGILRVTSLCTTIRCKFSLSDDDVSAIAIAMPNLVQLYLGGPPCSSAVNVSINGLAVFAANCTKLKELQIHFDTASFITNALDVSSEPTMTPRSSPGSRQLTKLIVGRVTLGHGIDVPWMVGMALLQIFPGLRDIRYQQDSGRPSNKWEEVIRVIKVQRNVMSLIMGDGHRSD